MKLSNPKRRQQDTQAEPASPTETPNPWHDPRSPISHRTLTLTSHPEIYRGHEIHDRPNDYLVVEDGKALAMLNGPNGARRFVDKALDSPNT
jgi:hypothetical protein